MSNNDFTSFLFNGQHSKSYNKIGKHLHLTNSRTTSSEATLPTFPKIAIVLYPFIVACHNESD